MSLRVWGCPEHVVPGLHGELIPTPVLGCPACATVRSIGGELGATPGVATVSKKTTADQTILDLADFLLARLAEDEAAARTISARGRWGWREFPAGTLSLGDDNVWAPYFAIDVSRGVVFPTASVIGHIARWDPARVLAECEAKRLIVQRWREAYAVLQGELSDEDPQDDGAYTAQTEHDTLLVVLRLLALPYADHPDYREEWRP